VLDVAARYSELGAALLPLLNPVLAQKYGLELGSFIIENVSLPPEVEQAIDKRSSMAAIGNLNDYVKLQMAEGLAKGGGGSAGAAAEIAMGFGMAQQMMNQPGGMLAPQATPAAAGAPAPVAAAPAASALPELLSPADAAKLLGVSEADVVASLTDGSLKGKKIGSSWRITRAGLEEFLKS
jgi:excisionase family DNA binding protein